MANTVWIITTTIGNSADARALARKAVEQKMAACAQIEPSISSFFVWKDNLEGAEETRISFKVSSEKKNALIHWLKGQHPYEVPEILAWEAESGHPDYYRWVQNV